MEEQLGIIQGSNTTSRKQIEIVRKDAKGKTKCQGKLSCVCLQTLMNKDLMNKLTLLRINFFFCCIFVSAAQDHSQNNKEKIHGNKEFLTSSVKPLFEKISPASSHVTFVNRIVQDHVHNFMNYSYVYNGGGVSLGDINNDGFIDIFLTSNQESDKLYINQGNFRFLDITDKAGVGNKGFWKNGSTMIDMNHDGFLDIYVCRSGNFSNPSQRANHLFINNGDLTFTERAEEYKIADQGFSVQAYFFDFDRDGDLDLYLVNHRIDFRNANTVYEESAKKLTIYESDKLYSNNGDLTFSDVSFHAGIANWAWGLSAAICDVNNDGWDDIYVANDYVEPDYLYINNKDGTFSNQLKNHFNHVSYFGMGTDVGDINNDGFLDLVVLDMTPEDRIRNKLLMPAMDNTNLKKLEAQGLPRQTMINTLHLNNGNGTFSEIAQLAGIAKTDWSWSPLFVDFDNDGYQDLFITNGIQRDITDNDFYLTLKEALKKKLTLSFEDVLQLLPSSKIQNYFFRNQGDLTFTNATKDWGIQESMNSNGAAIADLDNDGDLDVVVNNMEAPASIYKNLSREQTNKNFLVVTLKGSGKNPRGIGAEISMILENKIQKQRLAGSRGYLSSSPCSAHFGLGDRKIVEEILVKWPNGKQSKVKDVDVNQVVLVDDELSVDSLPEETSERPLFSEDKGSLSLDFTHKENTFDDFEREGLLPHKQSEHGPFISVGDVNKDGLEDVFVGGASGYSGKLYVQTTANNFIQAEAQPWAKDKECEDLGSIFFDSDNDGDLDLYVVSGGNQFDLEDERLQDRLYINQGKGDFIQSEDLLPRMKTSGLRVAAGDFDRDGDQDLFIGGRIHPGMYPVAPRSYLLENRNGVFKDVTEALAPDLMTPGMITDVVFSDFDHDHDLDIVLVGEWMPVSIYQNNQGRFVNRTSACGLGKTNGWWFRVLPGDWDEDGDIDFLVGNLGKNNKYKPTLENPLEVFAHDFDDNGTFDLVLAHSKDERVFPIRGRECSMQQLPFIEKKFPNFRSFAKAELHEIYSKPKLENSIHLQAMMFQTSIFFNNGENFFEMSPLNPEAQFSAVMGMVSEDFNEDGHQDILLAGNFYGTEAETTPYDASKGTYLLGDGDGKFQCIPTKQSGFFAPGNVRDLKMIRLFGKNILGICVTNNNDKLQIFVLDKERTTQKPHFSSKI